MSGPAPKAPKDIKTANSGKDRIKCNNRGGRHGDSRDCGSPLSSVSTAPTLDGASDASSPGDKGKASPAASGTPKAGESKADRFAAAFESIAERGPPKGKGKGKSRGKRESKDHGEGGASPTFRQSGNPGADGGDTSILNSSKPTAVIHKQIVSIVEKNSALQTADFDFRVRQHFHALYGQGGEERMAAAAAFIRTATMSKERESVRSWPAFIVALLRRFEQECPYQPQEQAQSPGSADLTPKAGDAATAAQPAAESPRAEAPAAAQPPTAPPRAPPRAPPTAPPTTPPVLQPSPPGRGDSRGPVISQGDCFKL